MKATLLTSAKMPAEAPPHTTRPEPLAYRIPDACHVLGLGKTSVYELMKLGKLKAIKVAGRTLIDANSARELIANATAAKAV